MTAECRVHLKQHFELYGFMGLHYKEQQEGALEAPRDGSCSRSQVFGV